MRQAVRRPVEACGVAEWATVSKVGAAHTANSAKTKHFIDISEFPLHYFRTVQMSGIGADARGLSENAGFQIF
jgi:hypothetical protein